MRRWDFGPEEAARPGPAAGGGIFFEKRHAFTILA